MNDDTTNSNIAGDISNITTNASTANTSTTIPQGQPVYVQNQLGQPVIVPLTPVNRAPPTAYYPQTPQPNIQYGNQNYPSVPPPSYEEVQNNRNDIVVVVDEFQLPRHSVRMKCPYCNKIVDTEIEYEDNVLVWGLCIILFIFTCLCCIPFCIKDIKDVVHYCPICRYEIAVKRRTI